MGTRPGIVLFAHGSRDPRWARPFEEIAAAVRRRAAHAEVVLAYLEGMRPSLAEAVAALVARETRALRIVPLFLGAGGHVREDLPRMLAELGAAHPQIELSVDPPIGEQAAVIDAIASAIAQAA